MARSFDIAEFRETDALDPTATRKLNHNFRSLIDMIREMALEGTDVDAVAEFVISVLGPRLSAEVAACLEAAEAYTREYVDQHGGGGGVTSYNDLTDKPTLEGVTIVGGMMLGNADSSDTSDGNYGANIHNRITAEWRQQHLT